MIAHGPQKASHRQADAAARQERQIQEAALVIIGLSPREREVVIARASGRLAKEIAYDLGIADATVRVYLHRSYKKLGGVGGLGRRVRRVGIEGGMALWVRRRPRVSTSRMEA